MPPDYRFDHLIAISDRRGLFEHADGVVVRLDHGYCTDDNARLLVVTSREPDFGPVRQLCRTALAFTLASQHQDGRVHNRMNRRGEWTDVPTTNDCWGRAVWALGAAAALHEDASIRSAALAGFDCAARQRSDWPRAMAFASLGAADVLAVHPRHDEARALLVATASLIGQPPTGSWQWPEARLRYANAAIAEAVIAVGSAIDDAGTLERGLAMLDWLLTLETSQGHLSPVGAGGRGPNESGPQFDQQPIEVAAMADACWRAFAATDDSRWLSGIERAAAWFNGDNDAGLVMFDEQSGGGYDGLHADRVNINQGAESTLAFISTMQRAKALTPAV
jgi:hypothetical protein